MFVYYVLRENSPQFVKDYYASEEYRKSIIHWKEQLEKMKG